MVFVGIDWSERWHHACLMNESGRLLGRRRVDDSLAGLTRLQSLIAEHAENPAEVMIGIETPHGLMTRALQAAGYTIYPINPLSASRYRDRHSVSKKKSDRGDAMMLADLVRTDRHKLRPLAEDTELAEAIKVLARSHKSLIWTRQQLGNQLRSTLREFYPGALQAFGEDLCEVDSLALLEQPAVVAQARGVAVADLAGLLRDITARIDHQEQELGRSLKVHPDAEIYLSQPGLGPVLSARVLGEFGDDPNTYHDGRGRKSAAGTSPLTQASGRTKVVRARFIRNDRLADACQRWALSALSASPGARRYYDLQRDRKKDHEEALRILANRLVGILHGCLRHRQQYREDIAWPPLEAAA